MPGWGEVEPSELVETWAPKAPNRRALVLGAGGGGDALWLARAGFEVDAVERDAARARLQVEGPLQGSLTFHVEDLSTFSFSPNRYGLLVALAVLHFVTLSRLRRAAPGIEASLCAGGLLIVQVLATDDPGMQRQKGAGAEEVEPNTFYVPELLGAIHFFEADELRRLFGDLEEVVLEKYRWVDEAALGGFGAGLTLVARKPAPEVGKATGAAESPRPQPEVSGGG